MVYKLTSTEAAVFLEITDPKTFTPQPASHRPVRASILRRVILGKPVWFPKEQVPRVVPIPESGLGLSYLKIVRHHEDSKPPHKDIDLGDVTGELNLQDACGPHGEVLPPLDLKNCLFPHAIRMSRARFRSLSLEGSRLTHLRANGIRVEGTLNFSHTGPYWSLKAGKLERQSSLSQTSPEDGMEVAHLPKASCTDATMPLLPVAPIQHLDDADACVPRLLPNQPSAKLHERLEQLRKQNPNGSNKKWLREKCVLGHKVVLEELGLCWIELRNSTIGIDLDVSSSILVAPRQDENWTLTNSAHARHALDLRGSHIHGRFTFSPSHLKQSSPFIALGGISIVRATIDGSVCGSGAILIACEGCALAASRVIIRSQFFLDYSWEGQCKTWTRFEAYGFVDLTAARVGASLYMNGAYLGRDLLQRGGLVASQIEIGNSCYLCAVENFSPDSPGLVPFESQNGVSLDKAILRGDLDMNGASLGINSFGKSLYAPGVLVTGTARLSIYPQKDANQLSHKPLRFTTNGPIVLEAADFRKDVNMWGCELKLASPTEHKRAINADLIHVLGCFRLDAIHIKCQTESGEAIYESFLSGTLSMQNASVGMRFSMYGATVHPSKDDHVAVDISGTTVRGDVVLGACTILGTLRLRDTVIERRLFLGESTIQAHANKNAIEALNLRVDSMARFDQPHSPDEKSLPHFSQKHLAFEASGCVDLTNASLSLGLWMEKAFIYGSKISTRNPNRRFALVAESAKMMKVELTDCHFVGHVRLENFQASDSLLANSITIREGILDLRGASLAQLRLMDCSIGGVDAASDVKDWERFDLLQLTRARIDGEFKIQLRDVPVHETSDTRTYPLADLRDLQVGSIVDMHCEKSEGSDRCISGWANFRLRLEGFNSKGLPNRKAAAFDWQRIVLAAIFAATCVLLPFFLIGYHRWSILLFAIPFGAVWNVLLSRSRTKQSLAEKPSRMSYTYRLAAAIGGGLLCADLLFFVSMNRWRWVLFLLCPCMSVICVIFRKSQSRRVDEQTAWLDRQYSDFGKRRNRIEDFVPSSYDRIAALLREEGYDYEADRVLRAKLWIRQKNTRMPERLLWFLYGHGFGFGLSSLAAMLTLASCLTVGIFCCEVARTNKALLHVPDPLTHEAPLHEAPLHEAFLYEAPLHEAPPCTSLDSAAYAFETFIPELKFVSPKTCEISPQQTFKGWRLARTFYIALGWIVTSITVLTIPGVLRKGAEG